MTRPRFHEFAICIGFAALPGCLGGNVTDSFLGNGLVGVTVNAQSCETCAINVTTTDANGIYRFDPYEQGPLITQGTGVDAVKLDFSMPGYHPMTIFHRVQWKQPIPPNQKIYDIAGAVLFASNIGDGDHDGVYNPIDTSSGSPYTFDEDGLDDSWELYGHDWVDYPSYGASITKSDMFIEIDYESYAANGVTHSARLSDAVVAKLVDFFAHLPTTPGTGVPGITLHIVQDQALPQGFDCAGQYATTANFHPKRRKAFRYVALCLGSPEVGAESIGGQRMYVRENEANADPGDDQTEAAQFYWYASILHAIGHTLGLRHGGGDDVNCKPNYVSLMNYAYDVSVAGSPPTLQDTKIQFATTNAPTTLPASIDEAALAENHPFSFPITPALRDVLAHYGDPGLGKGFPTTSATTATASQVDWNRNGTFQSGTIAADVTDGSATGGCSAAALQSLTSYDDTHQLTFGGRTYLPFEKPNFVPPDPSLAQVCHLH